VRNRQAKLYEPYIVTSMCTFQKGSKTQEEEQRKTNDRSRKEIRKQSKDRVNVHSS
jgi:hypothetical protein